MRLEGRVSIVTGGANGIGRAICEVFAREGATVVISDIDVERGEEVLNNIKEISPDSFFMKTDVSKEEEMKALIEKTVERFGKIDIMVNNAGIHHMGPITSLTEDIIDRLFAVNVKGTIWGMKYSIPYMLEKGKGVIINLSSMSGIVGHPNAALYCATKGAILQLTKATALEYATSGIRINALCPGTVDTNILRNAVNNSPDPEATLKAFTEAEPVKRLATPEEIARSALFLASDDSSFMTGAPLLVDGGFTAGK